MFVSTSHLTMIVLLGLLTFLNFVANAVPNQFNWIELQEPVLQTQPILAVKLNLTADVTNSISSSWSMYKHIFKKKFNDGLEEGVRFFNFAKNFVRMNKHNEEFRQGKHSYEMGVNKFSDWSESEFKIRLGYRASKNKLKKASVLQDDTLLQSNLPNFVDWRTVGAVTPVKDQGQCGSCYAFSTTGSLEGQYFKKMKVLPDLSEQQLVDCSSDFGNMGCNGGLMDNAFMYIKANNGIDDEVNYPYISGKTGKPGKQCYFNKSNVVANDFGFVDLPSGNQNKLKEAVAFVGPISIAINAGLDSFPHYHQGIYDDPNCLGTQSDLDHGVLLVGYGTENGIDYWLIKNSWGPTWGENGYIRILRSSDNLCGVSTIPSYPLV